MRFLPALVLLLIAHATASPLIASGADKGMPSTPVNVTITANGFIATSATEEIRVVACSNRLIHVQSGPKGFSTRHPKPWLLPESSWCNAGTTEFSQSGGEAILKSSGVTTRISLNHGNLTFADPTGNIFFQEREAVPHTYADTPGGTADLYHTVARFILDRSEAIYGLGQHQSGGFNYRGSTIELGHNNTDIAIPLLVSSRGYAILWNTASFTYVDNRFQRELTFDSLATEGVDYYVLYGPEIDDIIHQYRTMTGHAPLLPLWAYGYIQSKDRYNSLTEIREIADRYRKNHIPLDALVQDWFWWKTQGDPQFNSNYDHLAQDLSALHAQNVHTMISIWPQLDPDSLTYQEMTQKGLTIGNTYTYDASSSKARDAYWAHLPEPLFKQGWDSFWLDSDEPNERWPHGEDAVLRDKQLSIGNGNEYTNVFPLMHTEGIQDHWKAENPEKRVFLLSRSAFLGQQRVGHTVWSGDVYSSYRDLKNQIAGGLNYALSGLPYWTTDIGGYFLIDDDQFAKPAYRDLYLRWFQFGVFCPVFRSHGHRPQNEVWAYSDIEPDLIAADRLRYRLLPYIYSTAWRVTHEDYTIQRPLVMDFRADLHVRDIGDEFMFGPELLVSPITEEKATSRQVYFPANTTWYDFWTGERIEGGTTREMSAPHAHIPVAVRAGAILPLGPESDYAAQHPDGPFEIRVYPGANGQFLIYQDQGDGYAYERGGFSTIVLTWDDVSHTLTIAARQGTFAGMPASMRMNIALVHPHQSTGSGTAQTVRTIIYTGSAMKVHF